MKYRVHLIYAIRGEEAALEEFAERISSMLLSLESDAGLFTHSTASIDHASERLHVEVVSTGFEPYQLATGAAEYAVQAVSGTVPGVEVEAGVDASVSRVRGKAASRPVKSTTGSRAPAPAPASVVAARGQPARTAERR